MISHSKWGHQHPPNAFFNHTKTMFFPVVAVLVQATEEPLPSQIISEAHAMLTSTLDLFLFVIIELILTSMLDMLFSLLNITWHDSFTGFLLEYLELPLSAQQQNTSSQKRNDGNLPTLQDEQTSDNVEAVEATEATSTTQKQLPPSYPARLLAICIGFGGGSIYKTGEYETSGYSLFGLWQLCRLAVAVVPRGFIEGSATWMLLKEGLWYWRTRFGFHDIAEQYNGSSNCLP